MSQVVAVSVVASVSAHDLIMLESGEVSMQEVKEHVAKLKLYTIDVHQFVESSPGPLNVLDLPILDFPESGFVKCVVDVVMDVPTFSPSELKNSIQSKEFSKLPLPFGLKTAPSGTFRIDIAVLAQNNGKYAVIKIINLSEKTKVSVVRDMCCGKPHIVDWSGDIKTVKKCLHYLFEQMGGFQCRHHVLRTQEEGKAEQERSIEEWDRGFDYIEAHGPRDNTRNRMLRWVTIQTSSRDSPLHRWSPVLVEKSLRNLAQDGVLAQVHEVWPLTLYDLDVRFLNALGPLFASLSEKALGFHGVPGENTSGKVHCHGSIEVLDY